MTDKTIFRWVQLNNDWELAEVCYEENGIPHYYVTGSECPFDGLDETQVGPVVNYERMLNDRRVFFRARKLVKRYLNPWKAEETDWTKSEEMKLLCDAVTEHPDWVKK